jgi:hypothetical protein
MPGHVKLTFTLDLPRELAERLSARAIRAGSNLGPLRLRPQSFATASSTLPGVLSATPGTE